MANNDWDITKPIDHTKIGDVPSAIRDVTSSAGIIIAKEHETPGTDNAGGQHLMGAVRVSLQSGTPTLDPEGNSLDTTATTDNGRLSVDTGASNELTVFVATSAGVSTSWNNVRVARVKADEDLDANAFSVKNLASGTQAGEAIHIGQVDTTPSTGQLKLLTPATDAKVAVAVLDPPTEDGHIGSKKYIDAAIVTAIANILGAWTNQDTNTDTLLLDHNYKVQSAGFVVAFNNSSRLNNSIIHIWTISTIELCRLCVFVKSHNRNGRYLINCFWHFNFGLHNLQYQTESRK